MPERLKASAKDLEDKAQEAIRNLTGDRQDQAVGKAKQAESSTRNWFENVKDTVKGLFE
ncbi:MAG: CsbD family protein [Oscillatoriales cyanobacterium CG2_30_44_21]|nr:MAG: CsbD family protein [Oscillatoriales cyanobacterium CG2_30_44_21]